MKCRHSIAENRIGQVARHDRGHLEGYRTTAVGRNLATTKRKGVCTGGGCDDPTGTGGGSFRHRRHLHACWHHVRERSANIVLATGVR